MKGTWSIVDVILFMVIFHYSLAQDHSVKFNLVEGNNGEPLGNITGITQDTYGYMWFSGQQANCLYKYDGNSMIAYRHDSANTNSPADGNLETVYADNKGLIWIGFFNGGLDKFNPATGVFTHYRHSPGNQGSLSSGMVNVILRDQKGSLWIGTATGLDRFDETIGKFIHYRNDASDSSSLSSNVVRALYEDHNGTLWVGTGFPFDRSNPNDGGLNRMESNGSFTRFVHDPNDPHSLINNKVRSILEDSRGTFWVGTAGDGLHTMNRQTGSFERHLFQSDHPDQLSRPPLKAGAWYDHITFIKEDGSGAIWIGTFDAGVNRYDPTTKKTIHFEASNGYPDKGAWMAFTSTDGVLWMSAQELNPNLYRVDPSANSLKDVLTGNKALSFHEDKDGILWVGIEETGLCQYDQKKNIVKIGGNHRPVFNDPQIFSIFQDQHDTLWLSTATGIALFNKKSLAVTFFSDRMNSFTPLNEQVRVETHQIIRDKEGLHWFATLRGLTRYDPKTNSIKMYYPDEKKGGAISSDRITSVLEDKTGNIWAGAHGDGGINRLDKQKGQFSVYLKGISVNCLYQDKDGVIWSGTQKGLYRYNKATDEFTLFFDSQSDVGSVIVNGISEDNNKNLWISTQSAIVKLDAARTASFIYGRKFGIPPNSLIRGGIYKTVKGEILVGHKRGFYTLLPDGIAASKQPGRVLITNLFINDRLVLPGKGSVLNSRIEEADKLVLHYYQNNLSFQFALTDYRAPELNRYYAMMEGYDNTWREATGDKAAVYLNVPAGKYVLRVKVFNSDGVKAEKTIQVIVEPPWWKTWFAYSIYTILFIVGSWVTYRYQKRRIIRIEKSKAQEKELAHAKEIEKAYRELKATQAQLIQAEKMASLGELTAGIAHEIQNPLNFVNNFSELSSELIDEMTEGLAKGEIDDVKTMAFNIRKNLEKINHHGKKADAIVKGMLQHSHSSSATKEPTDVNKLVDEYLRLGYQGLRAKDMSFRATLKTDYDQNIGNVSIIPGEIGRVVLNLINNAFYAVAEKQKKSGTDYEPVVSASTKKMNSNVAIRVEDNGPGIPAKILDKIFQPFFTTKPTGQGTGLGLSLSYDIVKAHGGELKVESKEGEGAAFSIHLPI